jgi:hypothetical protein
MTKLIEMIDLEAGMFRRNKADRAIQECQLFHERSKEKRRFGGGWVVAISKDFP